MSSTRGERKSALLLASLAPSDRRRLLNALPAASAARVRPLLMRLLALRLPMEELAATLLADEVAGLTADTSLDVDQLLELSGQLPPAWFARVLAAWTGVNRTFCVSLLDEDYGSSVADELQSMSQLPPKLAMALKAEAIAMAAQAKAA